MARPRRKPVSEPISESTSTAAAPSATTETPAEPDIFDEQIAQRQQERAAETAQSVADSASAEPEPRSFASQHTPKSHAPGHIANPGSTRRENHAESVLRRLPDKMTVTAGDMKVQLVDAGRNEMGIGIRVVFPEGRKPTEEEKEIIRRHIRGEDGEQTGFRWEKDSGIWLKHILREGEHVDDVPPSRPVAIRLDAESRVQKLAEALREHSADPVGYAEMVQQRREQAANDRIPD